MNSLENEKKKKKRKKLSDFQQKLRNKLSTVSAFLLWVRFCESNVLRDKAGKWSVKAEKHDSVQDFNVNKGKML